jgi:AcrR family transcriptional regulator
MLMDRRAARTRRALHHALMALILRKGYEAITVQDILDEADVGRSTFYAHSTGKEDLLRRGFELLRADLDAARRSSRGGSEPDGLGFSLAMFEHAAGHADHYRAMVGGRAHAIVLAEIRKVLEEMAKRELRAVRNDQLPEELSLQFVVGTLLTTVTWWLERKPKLTPAQVNVLFRQLVIGALRPATRVRL